MINLVLNFISIEEETELLNELQKQTEIKLRHQLQVNKFYILNINELPIMLNNILNRINELYGKQFNSIQVNEYLYGQGIMPHIDDKKYGDTIVILSLKGSCKFRFRENNNIKDELILNERSLLMFNDKHRYKYTHSLSEVLKNRISIIFRTL
jgi:alkylated DNA repair dioxygenase AlkB